MVETKTEELEEFLYQKLVRWQRYNNEFAEDLAGVPHEPEHRLGFPLTEELLVAKYGAGDAVKSRSEAWMKTLQRLESKGRVIVTMADGVDYYLPRPESGPEEELSEF